mmetsp:Transcript_58728/g.101166  ORF Transcript_58728/g.101166 Transcript_58728/m.101166 type:complete len:386 (+) Transcript_58728:144-1301(+)
MSPSLSVQDAGFLALALLFNTFTAPAVKLTQNPSGGYDYNKYCIYFIAEMIKLSVAGGWSIWKYQTDREMQRVMRVTQRDILQYAIPGFVFFAQNNLSFVALQHMSNAAFQLLLNMRIVAVALLTVTVLGKSLNKVKWFAIVLLTNGAVQYQLSDCSAGGGALKTSAEGLAVMAVIIVCAAGGNVATQLVMQTSMDQPLMFQNSILYSWGVLLNGFNWWRSVMVSSADAAAVPWFGNLTSSALFLCLFSAVYGLSISVILKRFGSLTRTFISTVAIVFNAVLDWLFFGESLGALEVTTFLTIFAAIFLFTILGDEWDKAERARNELAASLEPPLLKGEAGALSSSGGGSSTSSSSSSSAEGGGTAAAVEDGVDTSEASSPLIRRD